MAGKFYAVKSGRTPGIYNTWDACKAQVDGYGGAIYKSFKTAAEAAAYMGWGNTEAVNSAKSVNNVKLVNNVKSVNNVEAARYVQFDNKVEPVNNVENIENTATLGGKTSSSSDSGVAYVDGSFNVATGEFSYGVVMFHNGEELHFNQLFNDKELATMRNVAGEIKGAEAAMQYAYDNQMKELTIYHDYEGISRWPLREWKANKSGTIAYQNFYDNISKYVNIKFVKVKGHSGDKYNDVADRLAKEALGL